MSCDSHRVKLLGWDSFLSLVVEHKQYGRMETSLRVQWDLALGFQSAVALSMALDRETELLFP